MENEEKQVEISPVTKEIEDTLPAVNLRAKKKPEPFCKNCMLYDWDNAKCKVVILYAGEKINLPMIPEDPCFFENEFQAVDYQGRTQTFKAEVEETKIWVEDPATGKRSENGVVKIQYPAHLFGEHRLGH